MNTTVWSRALFRPARSIDASVGTLAGWSQTAARVSLGVVMFPHGAQKALGWYGGGGIDSTLLFFNDALGIPAPVAIAVIAIEFLGAIALMVGAYSRLAALGVAAVMLGAICTVHTQYGFFMNWDGSAGGEGYEYHLLALGLAAAVVLGGSGRASLELHLAKRPRSS
jgi:putative oxidoreductase